MKSSNPLSLEELVGQTLVIGVPGTKATPEIIRHFKDLNAGGIIFYRINFESPAQLKKMISDLESALGRQLLVMADHEGGRVIMFRDGITVFPDNLAMGHAGKTAYAKMQGEIEAKELRRLGMDINLCPTLDVLTETYSPNIGIRSFGKDWKRVAEMGAARIRAMQKGGVSACAKHFPGKGHAPVDAHLSLPTIHSTWEEMEASHLKPFHSVIKAGIDLVMTSHPYYPNLDEDKKNIATFSRKIVYDYLRKKLNYKGVISSDDLEMGAIKEICPIGEAAVRTMQAGHDILLVCHDMKAQKEVYDALLWAYRKGVCSMEELKASVERIQKLKAKRKKRFEGGAPRAEKAGAAAAAKISREAVRVLNENAGAAIPNLKGKKVHVVFPRFSEFDAKIMIEREVLDEKKFVLKEFGKFKVKPSVRIVGMEPSDSEIEDAKPEIAAADVTVFFCYDAHLHPSNKKLLDAVQSHGKEVVVGVLRDPYDVEYVYNSIPAVTCFGWRACQIKAVIEKICRPGK